MASAGPCGNESVAAFRPGDGFVSMAPFGPLIPANPVTLLVDPGNGGDYIAAE